MEESDEDKTAINRAPLQLALTGFSHARHVSKDHVEEGKIYDNDNIPVSYLSPEVLAAIPGQILGTPHNKITFSIVSNLASFFLLSPLHLPLYIPYHFTLS
jgi:hypothetical protein